MTYAHAVTRDRQDWEKTKPGAGDYLRHAVSKSGRRPMDVGREYIRLHLGRGKLTLHEYVQYGVYGASPEEQARFITNNLHWPITHAVCDMTCQAATEDKWLCSTILSQGGIAVPETLAVVDRGSRAYPGTEKITTADGLRDFFTRSGVLPVFGKENRGIASFGAFLVEEAEADRVHLKGEGWMDYDACMNEFIGDTPYLLQRQVANHPFFDKFTPYLATVRVCLLVADDGVKVPFTVLKLPAADNLADSFWRPGNVACDVDTETGKVRTIRTKDLLGTTDHETHPGSGAALLGETVPMWQQVLDMARAVAPIFQQVRYQSMDIAITADGPVLIEINTGGGFDLPQLASGKGFLTDEVSAFFQDCGYRKL